MELVEELLDMYFGQKKMSAKSLCCLCWWAAKAGAVGQVHELKYRPGAQTGQFQKHLDRALGMELSSEKYVTLDVPGHSKYDVSRSVHRTPVLPPHEALHSELGEDPSLLDQLAEWVARDEFPAAYTDHVLVRGSEEPVLPLALYLDGVPFLKKDSMIGFFVYNLVSGRRHLAAVLRKSYICKCGCKGWCSIFPIMEMLHWSFGACAAGTWPRQHPSGRDWVDAEGGRKANGGLNLGYRAAVVYIKGDWAEYAHTLGFPTWASALCPCLLCWCNRENMYDARGLSPSTERWELATHADYHAACVACEREVTIVDQAQHREVRLALFDDKRPSGSKGRALLRDIPCVGFTEGRSHRTHTGHEERLRF